MPYRRRIGGWFSVVRNRKRTRGQALTEFAIAMPIFILMLLAVIDIAVLLYQEGSISYGMSEMNWVIEYKQVTDRTLSQEQKNELVKGAIVQQLNIAPENVTVRDAEFSKVTNPGFGYTVDDEMNGVWSATEVRLNLRFEATVEFTAVMPIPILGWRDVNFAFALDRVVPYESQFEVSWYPERGTV